MLSFLWHQRKTRLLAPSLPTGFIRPESGQTLLGTRRRQQLLEHIWQRTSLSRQQFDKVYRQPLDRFAELVQQLPASENHHHAHPGGMLDHGLEIVAYALKIRQTYLLPIGAPPESQSSQAEAWSAAATYGALVHDLGKIAVDLEVELQDGTTWHPWHGPIRQPYRFRYLKDREYRLHAAAGALLHAQILSSEMLDWLSGFPELWKSLIFALSGHYEHAGILGEIVLKADQASVAQALGGNPERALAAPRQSLQRQLAEGLRHLVQEKFKLNAPDGPSDGWLTQDALWLVSKPTADQLRAYLLAQGIEGIPSSNAPFFNMLQDQGVVLANAQDKAVWKVSIDNSGGWQNSLTMLKLSPVLIWPDPSQRPAPFIGTLSIEAIETGAETSPEAHQPEPLAEGPSPSPHPEGPTPTVSGSTDPTQDEPTTASDVDAADFQDLTELFDSITPPSEELLPPTSPEVQGTEVATEPSPQNNDKTAEIVEEGRPMQRDRIELGQGFVDWLRTGIASRRIIINDAKALVHTVDGTAMLVTPAIFKRFILEFPNLERQSQAAPAWQLVQRSFEKMKLHRKTAKGLNIWTCDVVGPRKRKQLRGYLLRDPLTLFTEVPLDNPSLTLPDGAQEVSS